MKFAPTRIMSGRVLDMSVAEKRLFSVAVKSRHTTDLKRVQSGDGLGGGVLTSSTPPLRRSTLPRSLSFRRASQQPCSFLLVLLSINSRMWIAGIRTHEQPTSLMMLRRSAQKELDDTRQDESNEDKDHG